MTKKEPESICSRVWEEEPEPDNPYSAAACYCAGYDVYSDLLSRAGWAEYMYLLFKSEWPDKQKKELLEGLSVALANPGPSDQSIRAAMNASLRGSSASSSLMAALAVGAGQYGGAGEVFQVMELWQHCSDNINEWKDSLRNPRRLARPSIWPESEYPAGFDPHGVSCATPVKLTLRYLASISSGGVLEWLNYYRCDLEEFAGCPLSVTGVAGAAFIDLGMKPHEGEMLYLLLRLPGAAMHALEQYTQWERYPFLKSGLTAAQEPIVNEG